MDDQDMQDQKANVSIRWSSKLMPNNPEGRIADKDFLAPFPYYGLDSLLTM